MRKPTVLVTGANGEVGHGLLEHFGALSDRDVVAVDLNPLDKALRRHCQASYVGDILDMDFLQRLQSEYEIHSIFHLAALLSTRAEYTPKRAHAVNVDGTLNLLELAHEQASWHGSPVKVLFPSSIAAYGLPDRATKERAGAVKEEEYNTPRTMYGCNKLYCEQLGTYFTHFYRQLAADQKPSGVDFRCVRFPGLISALTVPSGGTSDFGPEMIHAAARGEPYACFVDEQASLPFMTMSDAILSLVRLESAPAESLSQRVYNVGSFSLTAGQIRERVLSAFPEADISFAPDLPRSRIVDSWPADVDDAAARQDWGWQPEYDVDRAFSELLIPAVRERYRSGR